MRGRSGVWACTFFMYTEWFSVRSRVGDDALQRTRSRTHELQQKHLRSATKMRIVCASRAGSRKTTLSEFCRCARSALTIQKALWLEWKQENKINGTWKQCDFRKQIATGNDHSQVPYPNPQNGASASGRPQQSPAAVIIDDFTQFPYLSMNWLNFLNSQL